MNKSFTILMCSVMLLAGALQLQAQTQRSYTKDQETITAMATYSSTGLTDTLSWAYSNHRTTYLPFIQGQAGYSDTVADYNTAYQLAYAGVSVYNGSNQATEQKVYTNQNNMGWTPTVRYAFSQYYSGLNLPLVDSIQGYDGAHWIDSAVINSYYNPVGGGVILSGYVEYYDSSGHWSHGWSDSRRQTPGITYDTLIQYTHGSNSTRLFTTYGTTLYDGQNRAIKQITLTAIGPLAVILVRDTTFITYSNLYTNTDGSSYDTVYNVTDAWEGTETVSTSFTANQYDKYGNITSAITYITTTGTPVYSSASYYYYRFNPDATTGIIAVNPAPDLRVYPNPAANTVNIQWQDAGNAPVTLQLFDITGRELLHQTYSSGLNANTTLDLSAVNTGLYVLQLSTPQGNVSQKMEVVK